MSVLRFLIKRTIALHNSQRSWGKTKIGPFAIGVSSSLTFAQFFSTATKPLSGELGDSQSSTIFREASPAAYRKPSSQLVFLSKNEERRKDWESWIGYFREAGYDCIDMNIAIANLNSEIDALTKELHQQLRLLSLQRAPLVFAFYSKGSDEAAQQIHSSDPQMSGLVIVVPSSDKQVLEKFSNMGKSRLRILILDESQAKGIALQQAEKWMASQGLA